MIGVVFRFAGDIIQVNVDGNNVNFRTSNYGVQFYPIEALQFNKQGVIKEFPDLKEEEEWKSIAIKRFKEKLDTFVKEEDKAYFIIDDLKKYGYKPMYTQKEGHRPKKI